ncbi:MAG: hypothetical protein FWC89_10695 [Defluviitaleaceae bacterium]|nr:hypothetical protein [Defluviitaleaceae bacterium]
MQGSNDVNVLEVFADFFTSYNKLAAIKALALLKYVYRDIKNQSSTMSEDTINALHVVNAHIERVREEFDITEEEILEDLIVDCKNQFGDSVDIDGYLKGFKM